MRSFESFKAKRERMDPTSRKLSDSQWQQAYSAYKRVRGYSEPEEEAASEEEPSAGSLQSAVQNLHAHPMPVQELRLLSAYQNERKMIDLVYILSLVLIALLLLIKLYTGFTATQITRAVADEMSGAYRTVSVIQWGVIFSSLIYAVFQAALVYLARSLAQIFIDIADIKLREGNSSDA